MNEPSQQRISGAALMLALCLLPIFVFYLLLMFGVVVSPLVVLLVMILCCLAMSHMMMGSSEQASCHGHTAEPQPQSEIALPDGVGLDDLIRIKEHINRPKDRDSLMHLRAIKKLREQGK